MSIRAISTRAARLVDRGISSHVALLERSGLLTFLFHSLFDDRRQIDEGTVHPQDGLTKNDFRRFIEYFLEHRYEFVSNAQIRRGLEARGRYVHITFDDGYANNLLAIDVLEAFEVPATIFVTTEPVATNTSFWWDVVYRERRRRGSTDDAIEAEMRWLKKQRHDARDLYLESEFGPRALRPLGDADRPLTRDELVALARNRWITIGNHTKNHAILTGIAREEVRTQLVDAQSYLESAVGHRPDAVAYPNGDYDATVLETARDCGFRVGLTADRRKNRLPAPNASVLALGRHVIERDVDLAQQLRVSRSELQLANFGRRVLHRRGSTR